MDMQDIANIVYKDLRDAGYTCEENCGTVWIDGSDGKTYALTPTECEGTDGEDARYCCRCGTLIYPETGEYCETEDGKPICADCKKHYDEELEKVMGNLEDMRK